MLFILGSHFVSKPLSDCYLETCPLLPGMPLQTKMFSSSHIVHSNGKLYAMIRSCYEDLCCFSNLHFRGALLHYCQMHNGFLLEAQEHIVHHHCLFSLLSFTFSLSFLPSLKRDGALSATAHDILPFTFALSNRSATPLAPT